MEVDPTLTERIRNSQEEQDAAWIYGPPTASGTVNVVEYDPNWPQLFSREQQRIHEILGDVALSVDHVGSTSVPGLAAKPIIDIDLVVPNSADESTYVPQLEAAGYLLIIREPDWHEHRCLKGPDTNINLHVFSPGSPETLRHAVFRDWLRTHPDDRDLYARTKLDLASQDWSDTRGYTQAKDDLIDAIYLRAFGVA
ncbi:MAG TPA: GrpB family protein [Acidothermaceae bacterium]